MTLFSGSFWLHPSQADFDSLTIGGLFSLGHFFLSFGFLLIAFLCWTYLSQSSGKRLRAMAVFLLALEGLRMSWNVLASDQFNAKDVFPLYMCGIFVVLFPLYAFDTKLKTFAKGFIVLGAAPSGILFMLFPTTGIGMFPFWHYNTIQSALMHTLMATLGLWFFVHDRPKPQESLTRNAIVIVTLWAGVAWFYNLVDPATNFFFLAYPLLGTPLVSLASWLPQPIYGFVIYGCHLFLLLVMGMVYRGFHAFQTRQAFEKKDSMPMTSLQESNR